MSSVIGATTAVTSMDRAGAGRSLASEVWATARRQPDRPAVVARGETLTYGALVGRAAAIAACLVAARGAAPAGRVALLGNKAVGTYAGLLGILAAGATYVPLNARFPLARSRAMLDQAGIEAVVLAEDAAGYAADLLALVEPGIDVVLLGSGALPSWCLALPRHRFHREPPPVPAPVVDPPAPVATGQPAYLLFTSGSTGQPKGIAISHANALAYLDATHARYAPGPDDRFSQTFDLTFDLAMHDIFLCWVAGAALYPLPATGGLGAGSFIRRHGITFWFSVPAMAALMARHGELRPEAFPGLRWSLFCGEALPARLACAWAAAATNSVVENLYGPTEATIAFTAFRLAPSTAAEGIVPLGLPLTGGRVAVIGPDGALLEDGQVGEVCLGGPQVAEGYWQRPDLTSERFRAPAGLPPEAASLAWYRTGDLGLMTPDQGLVYRGRADRQVKLRGYRVELGEIEDAMRAAGDIHQAAALLSAGGADMASAAVVGLVPKGAAQDAILAGCRRALPDYMVPQRLIEVVEWPLNANGKTDYTALQRLMEEEGDA